MGIYKEIFKKLKERKQNKTKKPKTMPKFKKLTPEQKAKFKKLGLNIKNKLISGDIQKGATVATRYAQGKPIVLKKEISKEDASLNPEEFIIFGIPVKKTYAYIGGALLLGGTIYGVSKMRRH